MSQPDPVRTALVQALTADETLPTVFHGKAKQGATPPYIIINQQSGVSVLDFAGGKDEVSVWLIKAVCTGFATEAENLDAACQSLLHAKRFEMPGARITVMRESRVSYDEPEEGGTEWRHVGSLYRVTAAPHTGSDTGSGSGT